MSKYCFAARIVTYDWQGACVSELRAYLKLLSQLLSEVTGE
jgi:hypothetical protein